jgi:DNA-binding transcriptional regulator YdaS (Cro superfamily)
MTEGLSREAMARKIGVSASMIQHLENGDRKISAERAIAIERATGLPRSMIRPDLWEQASA